jgi:hypothetical protein
MDVPITAIVRGCSLVPIRAGGSAKSPMLSGIARPSPTSPTGTMSVAFRTSMLRVSIVDAIPPDATSCVQRMSSGTCDSNWSGA